MSTRNTEITEQRKLTVGREEGSVQWRVNQYDGGRAYLLSAEAANAGVHFSAHFTAEQWAEFQKLIDPPVPDFTIERVPS